MVYNKRSGKPRGYAFIEYEHERDMHCEYPPPQHPFPPYNRMSNLSKHNPASPFGVLRGLGSLAGKYNAGRTYRRLRQQATEFQATGGRGCREPRLQAAKL